LAENELEALMDKKLSLSQERDLMANKSNSFLAALSGVLQHIDSRDLSSVFSTVEMNLECWVWFWGHQCKRDTVWPNWKTMKITQVLEHLSYEKRLQESWICSVQGRESSG